MKSVILQAGTRFLVGLLLIFSIHMLLRGHNLPGGGFIGGLIGATGFVIHVIACGTSSARRAIRVGPQSIAMVGLGIALAAGLMPILFSQDLFTGQWLFLGATETDKGLPISSVLMFDIGVYLVVLGSVLTLVFALEEEA